MTCSWPVDRTCLPQAQGEVEVAQQEAAEDLAVQVLWALSGRQYGVCPVIIRPCPQPCAGVPAGAARAGGTYFAYRESGRWLNVVCGCGAACAAQGPGVLHLATRTTLPIQGIEEVSIAGAVLDPAEYRLEGDLLYRVSGNWPSQDLTRPLGQSGTWAVTILRGYPPPAGSDRLVALLAAEFLAACRGGKCKLPRRVRSVSRQGVTYDMVDPTDIYREGRTGIPEVDLWLSSVNPRALAAAPEVR